MASQPVYPADMRYAIAIALAALVLSVVAPIDVNSSSQTPSGQAYPPPFPPPVTGAPAQPSTPASTSAQPQSPQANPHAGHDMSQMQHGTATNGAPQSLADLDKLVGHWSGTSKGKSGDGTIDRECDRILNGQFIQCKTRVAYPRETHSDVAIFSFDRSSKKVKMRQFHEEGFVNEYTQTEPGVFVSDSIENLGSGWRARESYHFMEQMWHETFSLAGPGKEYETYSEAALTRK